MTLERKLVLKQGTKCKNHKSFDKSDHIKIKIFCSPKDTIEKAKAKKLYLQLN